MPTQAVTNNRAAILPALQASGASLAQLAHARIYFDNLSDVDFANFDLTTWLQHQHSLFTCGAQRLPAQATITTARTPTHAVIQVITDDMPFLVDSILAAVQTHGLTTAIAIYPLVHVTRTALGALQTVSSAPDSTSSTECWMQFFISRCSEAELQKLQTAITAALANVRRAVTDWQPMRQKLKAAADQLVNNHRSDPADITEIQEFLDWLDNGHFTFLGCRDFTINASAENFSRDVVKGSGLGVLAEEQNIVFAGLNAYLANTPEARSFWQREHMVLITKTNTVSTVHRAVPMDAIFIKLFNQAGAVIGERLVVGLFTSLAYSRNTRDIPLLRRKASKVFNQSGLSTDGHDGKALIHILDTFPRDELFQISSAELFSIAMGITRLQERLRTALFVRPDPFNRFVSCFIYLPRENFNSTVRQKIMNYLAVQYQGRCQSYNILLDSNPLARLHVIVHDINQAARPDLTQMENAVAEICRSWADKLRAVLDSAGQAELFTTYAKAFPLAYQEVTGAEALSIDITQLEAVRPNPQVLVKLVQQINHPLTVKIYAPTAPLNLATTLPIFENMGFHITQEDGPYCITLPDDQKVWLHCYHTTQQPTLTTAQIGFIEELFLKTYSGVYESDKFNSLVLQAGIKPAKAMIFRALAKYLKQIKSPYSPEFIATTLAAHPAATQLFSQLFSIKFNPEFAADRVLEAQLVIQSLKDYIHAVPNEDEDNTLSAILNVLQAAVRTNHYQQRSYLSIKFLSAQIDLLPLPKPYAEIFVYSPQFEGIHLRGGKIARGGIRWSDRPEDFRTEILALMKAQMVKNTVIVPTGAKGGFVVKRAALANGNTPQQAGIDCYKNFIRALLDITDNHTATGITTPPQVIAHDGADPYIVAAADKGTAKFSDTANEIAASYHFWLGDAFASGGKNGYDHKEMGITAKGAWVALERHFNELGHNVRTTPFTCVGVGDMAGDVFGNGLLHSPQTKLLAAFNYAHIFLDPTPDCTISYAERQRLFAKGSGSWDEYDISKISAGGGVFSRAQKIITITPQVQAALGIAEVELSANELIQRILQAPVDLLYLGGIGTYVKASAENDAEIGDKANDKCRVDARTLRAKIVGEGANLGFSQLARIEYALAGGRINTDAIDNSGGVDCSDHEVNLKILLASLKHSGTLTEPERQQLLHDLTPDIAAAVLADNAAQTLALSLMQATAAADQPSYINFMRDLEQRGDLNRKVEFLPSIVDLEKRSLTRPELAVLLAYGKSWLYNGLMQSALPDKALQPYVLGYFPKLIQQNYHTAIYQHQLARAIGCTVLANEIINRLGLAGVYQITQTKPDIAAFAAAYLATTPRLPIHTAWAELAAAKPPATYPRLQALATEQLAAMAKEL